MFHRSLRSTLLVALAATAGFIAAAPLVEGATQDVPSDTSAGKEQETQLEEVVVTGSLIARPDVETAEAITIITADSLRNQGITTVDEALQQLSANQTSAYQVASSVTTYTGGGAFANLRDLGRARTLVLLDGQRLANNVTIGNAVDLSGIPFAAIDHIEVLREGASSLYGTDAMAGVINFITKKDYDKGELNLNLSKPQHAGGAGGAADATYGHGNLASDGYNFMVAVNYTKTDELTAPQRAFASTGFDPARGLANVNDPGNVPGSYEDANQNYWQVGYPACANNPQLVRYPAGNCSYLYSAVVDLIPRSDEWSGLASFTKLLAGDNTVNVQYFWTRSFVQSWGGPNEYGFTMNPGSPYYPTAANSTCEGTCNPSAPDLTAPITAFWTDPNNARYLKNTNTEQRVLLTFAGKNAGWDYSTSLNFSKNTNDFAAAAGYPNPNIIAPNNVVSPLINPFSGTQTAAGQALINSSYVNGDLALGNLSLWSLSGHAGHELGDAFGAGRPAAFALGASVEGDRINYNTNLPLTQTLASITGFSPEITSGSRTSKAAYLELNVPVIKGFEFTASDREDWYSDFGQTNNAKLSFRYQPVNILTFRGAASTGFRAPSLVNEYQPQFIGATASSTMAGPGCASHDYNAVFTQVNCNSQGLGLFGGNKNLKPETSENFDLGFAVEPLPNLGITVDYYRVLIKQVIQSIPAIAIYQNPTQFANQYVLNNAGTLSTSSQLALQCANGAASPTCGYVLQTPQNTGGITTDGFDINANYLIRSDFGKFRIGLDATIITQYLIQEYQSGPELNLVGQFNEGNQPAIRWQYLLSLDWTSNTERWGAGLQNRFLSRYADEFSDVVGVSTDPRQVGTYSIWNGYLSFKPIDPLTLLFGIRNLFDTTPPFSNQTLNWQAGYNPLFSDPSGRTFYGTLKFQF
jgi:iron complex outermembrane recepter protein